MKNETLKGKVVVITGASSGFGKGAALAFAQEGAHVVLAARREELLAQLARDCEAAGGKALPVPTDVSKREEVETLAEAAVARFGRIDLWINNAGVGALGRFEDVPLEDHVQVIETDLLGVVYGTYYAYREFLDQGSGTVINVASEPAHHTVPNYTSYAAAKHGVVGLGDALRQEIEQNKRDGIHVCTVMPTAHDTPFFDHVANYTGHEVQTPAPLHDPKEVVDALIALARDPKDNQVVGRDGVAKVLLKSLRKAQIEDAPPAGDSPGAVHAPMDEGTTVRAGRS